MAEFPGLMFYTDAYLADTGHLSTIEHGAYLLMLFHAWRTPDCSLPDDDEYLARVTRMDMRTWRKHKATLLSFWGLDTQQRWRQARLSDSKELAADKRDKSSKAGIASAMKRKNRDLTNVERTSNGRITDVPLEYQRTFNPKSTLPIPLSDPLPDPTRFQIKNAKEPQPPSSDKRPAAAASLSAAEWAEPDRQKLAFDLARELAPKHWVSSAIPKAQFELEQILASAVNPTGVCESIRKRHEVERGKPQGKNTAKQEFCYWIKDGHYLYEGVGSSRVLSGIERDLALAAELEKEEAKA